MDIHIGRKRGVGWSRAEKWGNGYHCTAGHHQFVVSPYICISIYICSSIIIGFFFYFYGCIHFSLIDPGGFIHFYLKGVGWVELVQVNSSGWREYVDCTVIAIHTVCVYCLENIGLYMCFSRVFGCLSSRFNWQKIANFACLAYLYRCASTTTFSMYTRTKIVVLLNGFSVNNRSVSPYRRDIRNFCSWTLNV